MLLTGIPGQRVACAWWLIAEWKPFVQSVVHGCSVVELGRALTRGACSLLLDLLCVVKPSVILFTQMQSDK